MSGNEDLYKVCPECGGEYQYTVATCVDCGVPLVFPEEIARRDARELPLSPGLVRLRTAPILWVRALAADLARAGIPYAVDRRKAREEGLLSLYVRGQDLETAAALDAAYGPGDAAEEPATTERREDRDEPDYKVCPECGGEYRREIERCADCGIALVEPSAVEAAEDDFSAEAERHADVQPYDDREIYGAELAAVTFPRPPRHELPPSDDLVCFCCRSFPFLASFSDALDDAGIAHRIERGPFERLETRACLYLRPMDCEAAEDLMASPEEEIAAVASTARACPACGTSLQSGVSDCPGCGLAFGTPVEVPCPRCGAILDSGLTLTGGCPNCGSAIDAR